MLFAKQPEFDCNLGERLVPENNRAIAGWLNFGEGANRTIRYRCWFNETLTRDSVEQLACQYLCECNSLNS